MLKQLDYEVGIYMRDCVLSSYLVFNYFFYYKQPSQEHWFRNDYNYYLQYSIQLI